MRVRSPLVTALLVPAAACAVAIGPVPRDAPRTVPVVQVEAIALAGIGQNIYNAITPVVQSAVGGVSYVINFAPLIGAPIAAQTNIIYFQGIQPSVAATVNYAAAVLADPLDFFPITRAYLDTVVGIGYDVVSAELRFLGFNELPPRPTATLVPSPRVAASSAAVERPRSVVVAQQAPAPAAAVPSRTSRARKAATGLTPEPKRAARSEGSDQARGSVETRRQKSTTGRTRSAI